MRKCSVIAIVGAPNAGKSTLVNHMVGQKISIVTPKPQTTRGCISGIITKGETQIILTDTPGIFSGKKTSDKAMVKAAFGSFAGADMIALIVDAKKGLLGDVSGIVEKISRTDIKRILILNKVDLVKGEMLLKLAAELSKSCEFDQIFMISALKDDGVDDVKNYFLKSARESEWLYSPDQRSDIDDQKLAEEITREKLMMKLDQELPYAIKVATEKWDEDNKSLKISQVIYVVNEGHKKIIVGKGGAGIKEIGEKSRKELSHIFGKNVSLFLFVKTSSQGSLDENI